MLQVVEVLNIHCISRNGQQLYIMCMGLSLNQTNTDFTKTQRVAKGIFDPSDKCIGPFLLSAQRSNQWTEFNKTLCTIRE